MPSVSPLFEVDTHIVHPPTDLLFSQLQQLFLRLLHLPSGSSDGHLVRAGALGGEMDVDAAAVFHDGAHEAAFGADQRVVQLGRDGDLRLLNVGLEGKTEAARDYNTVKEHMIIPSFCLNKHILVL